MIVDTTQDNFFGSAKLNENERFLGVGASTKPFDTIFSSSIQDQKLIQKNIDSPNNKFPDIYYIILDEYGSNNTLEKFFGYDNSKFASFLEENGFFVVSESHSNYPTTIHSLSASINMEYVNYLTEKVGKESKNFRMLNQILSDNKVMQKLHAEGYNIINMGSLWGPNNEFKNVNANICEFKEINRDSLLRELLQTSMISYLQEMWTYEVSRDRVSCIFDELSTLDQEYSNPKFVFAHIMLPHAPYIFGPNGEAVTPHSPLDNKPWDPKKAHIDQIKFANKQILILVDTLLSQNNNSIMIIQGDTGSAFNGDWDNPSEDLIIERMSNLNAIYFPNGNYEAFSEHVTPVNLFRIIFNEFFDANYTLLEDNMYWSTNNKPYAHKDVSNILLKDNEI